MISQEEFTSLPAVFLRILGVITVLPIGQSISNMGKTFIFSLGLSLFFAPLAAGNVPPDYFYLIVEFIIGLLIGLPAALTVEAVRSLGELFDSQRGLSFASLYDPAANHNTALMSLLASNFCILVLISGGLLENILFSLKESFELFPVYSLTVSSLQESAVNLMYFIAFICGSMFKSFLLCALIFLTIDISSVFLSKVLNQTGLNQEVFLVKSFFGLLLLLCILKMNIGPSMVALSNPKLELISRIP